MLRTGLLAAALVGALLAVVRPPRLGGAVAGDGHPLPVGVWFVSGPGKVFRDGDPIHSGDPVSVAYENRGLQAVNVMAFAVDAQSNVHWLAPLRGDPHALDWSVGNLGPTATPMLVRGALLDLLPPGQVRFIYLAAQASIGTDRIDALPPQMLNMPELQTRFPDALVGQVVLNAG